MKRMKLLLLMAVMTVLLAAVIWFGSPYAPPVEPMREIEELWAIEDARSESEAPLITQLENYGIPLAYDKNENTFYCTLGLGNADAWPELHLTIPGAGGVTVCFVDDYMYDSCADAIAEGYSYELMAYSDTEYSYFSIVFTGLPLLSIHTNEEITLQDAAARASIATASAEESVDTLDVRVHLRGDGSYRYLTKKSYKLEFARGATGSVSMDVPGVGATDHVILLSMGFDETYMHDKLSWDVLSRVYPDKEVFSPRPTAYAELFVNDQYEGLYLMSTTFDLQEEMTRENKEGVYTDSIYRTTNPAILKDRPVFIASDGPGYEMFHAPDASDPFAGIENYLKMRDVQSDEEFIALAKAHLDIESTLRYTLLMQAMALADNSSKNMYIWEHVENGVGRYRFEVWDMDLSWDRDVGPVGDYWYANKVHDRVISLDVDGARDRFAAMWEDLKSRGFTLDLISLLAYQYYDELTLSGAYYREAAKWGDGESYLNPDGLISDMQMRLDWMDTVTAYIAETDGVIPFLDVGARQEDHFHATYDDLSSIVE